MKILSQDLMSAFECSKSDSRYYAKFEVYGYYLDDNGVEQTDDVVVTITADGYTQVDNYIRVPLGTEVTYQVSREHYVSSPPSTCVVTGDTYKRVKISNEELWQFNVDTTPEDASVTIIGNGQTTTNKSIEVPRLTTVTYSVSRNQMNPISNKQRLVPMNEEEGHSITVHETLTSTISVSGVKDSRTGQILENAQVRWIVSQGDPIYGNSTGAVPCANEVDLLVSLSGYDSYPAHFPESGSYLVNRDLGYITLIPTVYYCTVSCDVTGAIIVMWKEVNGVEVPESRIEYLQGSAEYPCYVGDEVHWSVSAEERVIVAGYKEIPVGGWAVPPIDLPFRRYDIVITSQPSQALVTIYDAGNNQLAQGEGEASAVNIQSGSIITYTATLGGVTQTKTVTINSNYSDTLTLNAATNVTLVTSTPAEPIQLPYGRYKFLLIGAGAGGFTSSDYEMHGESGYLYNSPGGGGGGSGYIEIIDDIMISETNGGNVSFVVGSGGAAGVDGGDTSVAYGGIQYTAQGGKAGYSQYSTPNYYRIYAGGDGGSAGGAGGVGCRSQSGGSIQSGTDGGMGATAGGNGQGTQVSGRPARSAFGGTGYYNTVKSYKNNEGVKPSGTSKQNGNPGGGGNGLSAVSSDLTNANYFALLNDLQTLYNNIDGGGGGSAAADIPYSNVIGLASVTYGGGGGGGGGWQNGSSGTTPTATYGPNTGSTGGTGGDGAILYMRVAWS